jgi:hypothetical protein
MCHAFTVSVHLKNCFLSCQVDFHSFILYFYPIPVQIVFPVHSFLHLFLCYVLSFFFLHILSHTHTSFLTPPLSLYPRFILLSPSLTLSLSHSLTHFCLNVDGTEAKSRNCICFLNGRSSSSQYLKVFFSVMLWRSTLALFAENIFL